VSILQVSVESNSGPVRVVLTGELDISSAGKVEEELTRVEAGDPELIVLDLRGLEFMDSSGLRTIVSADSRAREGGRRIAIVRGPAAVQRIFDVTRLDERLALVDDPADAA
jgi:anti-anti-sigma factor